MQNVASSLHVATCHVDLLRMQHVTVFLHVENSILLSRPCSTSSPQVPPFPASSCNISQEQFPWGNSLNKMEQNPIKWPVFY